MYPGRLGAYSSLEIYISLAQGLGNSPSLMGESKPLIGCPVLDRC